MVAILCLLAGVLQPSDAWARKPNPSLVQMLSRQVDQALVQAPEDGEVCFSPDESCDLKLVKFIDSARASLDVAIFDLTLDQVAHHLLLASRKLPVRVIVDRRQAKSAHSLVRTLVRAGVPVRIGSQRGIMHDKFTIVDSARLETGSFNYTDGAAFKNQENQLYLGEAGVVDRYRQRFERMWREARPADLAD